MFAGNWLRDLRAILTGARKARTIRRRPDPRRLFARRLTVDRLEDRTVPTTFTRTSPTSGGLLPTGVTEVGGIVLDMIGTNGARIVSQLSAGSLWSGYFTDTHAFGGVNINPGTIGTQTGFNSTVISALGGGIAQLSVRITLSDGDTGPLDFDENENTLRLNGINMGNFSDVVTRETTNDGLTELSTNSSGGFRNAKLDTGFFFSSNSTFLTSFYNSLVSGPNAGQVVFQLFDTDPGDNNFDFTAGVNGGLVNVGQPPNVSPVVNSVSNNGPITEGGMATVTVNATDPDNTTGGLTYEFDFDNNGSYEVSNTTGVAQRSYPDNGTYPIKVRVTDTRSGAATSSTTITVNNAAPAVTAPASQAASEGTATSFNLGSFNDAGLNDNPWVVTVAWGDGSLATTFTASAQGALGSRTHAYADSGSYPVTVSVKDKDGAVGSNTFAVAVANVAPTVSITAISPAAPSEGGAATVNGIISDPAGANDNMMVIWSVTGPGGFTTASTPAPFAGTVGGTPLSFVFTPPDDGLYAVVLSASDEDGGSSAAVPVTVSGLLSGDTGLTTDFNLNTTPVFPATFANRMVFDTPGYAHSHGGAVDAFVEVHNPVTGQWTEVFRTTVTNSNVFSFGGLVINFPGQVIDQVRLNSSPFQSQTYHNWATLTLTIDTLTGVTVPAANVAPSLSIGAATSPTLPNEGAPVTVSGSVSDPAGANDTMTVAWSVTGPGGYSTASSPAPFAGSAAGAATSLVFTPPDNGVYTVVLSAHDEDGGTATPVTRLVTVSNVAPSLTLNPVAPVNENGVATLSGTIADPGTSDTFTLTLNWGDPLSPNNDQTLTFGPSASGTLAFTVTHQYLDDNPSGTPSDTYIIGAAITDDDGATGTSSSLALTSVTGEFSNTDFDNATSAAFTPRVATQLTFSGPGFAHSHSGTVALSVDVHDAGTGLWVSVYSQTLSSGAQFNFNGLSVNFASRTIDQVRLTSNPGQGNTYHSWGGTTINVIANPSEAVAVANVAPTVALAPVGFVNEGGTATVAGTITDPGTLDPHMVTISWGDGSPNMVLSLAAGVTTFSGVNHQYLDDGPSPGNGTASDNYAISVRVTDDDGGTGSSSTTITVQNVAPASVVLSGASINENGVATVAGSFADPGTQDRHTVVVNWGPGETPTTLALLFGARDFILVHQYLDDNPSGTATDAYPVSVSVLDDDGGVGTAATTVTVQNVAPASVVLSGASIRENGVATVAGSFTDPGTLDVHTIVLNWGPGETPTTATLSVGQRDFTLTHQYLDDNPTGTPADVFAIAATISDDDAGAGTATASVTVANVAPTVVLNPVAAISENGVATLSGVIADPGTADSFTLAINWGDPLSPDNVQAITFTASATGSQAFTLTHQYTDDNPTGTPADVYTIAVTVTDDDTGSDSAATIVTVNNVAPASVVLSGASIGENGVATVSGSFTDPGTLDVHTVVLDWGLAETPTTVTLAVGQRDFTLTHQYLDDNPTGTPSDVYAISATVTDDDGGTGVASASATVANVAPAVVLNAVAAISENGMATLTGTITDPGTQDSFTLSVNWGDPLSPNNAETYTFAPSASGSQAFTLTHQYKDDNPSGSASDTYAIAVTVTDDDTGLGTAGTSVSVNNVAPSGIVLNNGTVSENGTFTLAGSFTDPGTLDTHTVVIVWGPGEGGTTLTLPAGVLTFSASHQYLDDNPSGTAADVYPVSVTVTDDDTGVGTAGTSVTVTNVAPSSVVLNPVLAISENGVATLTGSFTDPGTQDVHTVAVNWGPGETPTTVTLAVGQRGFTLTHQYNDDNPTGTPSDSYPIAVTVTDDDTGVGSASTSVTVNNVAPTVILTGPATGSIYAAGAPVTFTGTYADTGTLDTHKAFLSFTSVATGTITTIPVTISGGAVSIPYTFSAAGVYHVTLTVTDDDTGSGSATTVGGFDAMVVVYDPSAGFVTGGGWINSPAEAYAADPTLTGKANFGFVSKYQKGATVPTGQTEFQFKVANFNFHSSSYDWLVIAGSKAQYKGSGTINGAGDYAFMLTAVDGKGNGGGGVDKFRIKIWNKGSGGVIYDNQMGASDDSTPSTALGGGSIVIQKGSPQLAAGGQGGGGAGVIAITPDQVAAVLPAAVARWAAAGLSAADLARLQAATAQVADLPEGYLGAAEMSGDTITIDLDAAGYGWFVDATPGDDAEFTAVTAGGLGAGADSPAGGRMDLLTVVMHELGHVIGLDSRFASDPSDLMAAYLGTGDRRLAATAADPGAEPRHDQAPRTGHESWSWTSGSALSLMADVPAEGACVDRTPNRQREWWTITQPMVPTVDQRTSPVRGRHASLYTRLLTDVVDDDTDPLTELWPARVGP
jgi:hypothetical protein